MLKLTLNTHTITINMAKGCYLHSTHYHLPELCQFQLNINLKEILLERFLSRLPYSDSARAEQGSGDDHVWSLHPGRYFKVRMVPAHSVTFLFMYLFFLTIQFLRFTSERTSTSPSLLGSAFALLFLATKLSHR